MERDGASLWSSAFSWLEPEPESSSLAATVVDLVGDYFCTIRTNYASLAFHDLFCLQGSAMPCQWLVGSGDTLDGCITLYTT